MSANENIAVSNTSQDNGEKKESNEESSSSSTAGSTEDYELIAGVGEEEKSCQKVADEEKESPELAIVVGEGKQEDLQSNLKDCISPEDDPATNEGLANESHVSDPQDKEDEHTVFHNIFYLGARLIENPKSEEKIQSQIREANEAFSRDEDPSSKKIILNVPKTSEGAVSIICEPKDEEEKNDIVRGKSSLDQERFPIHRIIFFARGNADGPDSSCFAFTCVHDIEDGDSNNRYFKSHIFRCQMPEAVSKVFVSFAQAFKRSSNVPASIQLKQNESFKEQESFLFDLTLEIKEKEEGKNIFENVPRQKGLFKLRSNVEKKVVVTLQQISRTGNPLNIERCFGMLVSPGRNVRHADMQLLEKVTMATGGNNNNSSSDNIALSTGNGEQNNLISYVISGSWDPSETAFAVLNQETPPDIQSVYITIATDLVIQQVTEPVRFVIETKARIYPSNERYWYYAKKNLCKQYQMRLKRSENPQGDKIYDVCGIDVSEEIDKSKMSLTMQLANLTVSTFGSFRGQGSSTFSDEADLLSPQPDDDDDDEGEEPLLSGFGDVSKDCSGTELEMWSKVLQEWDEDNPLNYPKQLPSLVKLGVPEALRGEVWQRVTGASVVMDGVIENYRILVTKESPDEKVILRDIHRTFPAHEFFKEAGGVGQESLYRIAKAYSIYDSEIGYCQGQSFLIAALLLQMPEEQAFGVLTKVMMHRWGLRDMFKENFEQLQLRLYQLDRLIETNMPDLWQHFGECGIESHMYASQWFLTIFTAKFPLFLVFRVLDCFLLYGFDTIFQVALAILKVSKRDLLSLDFEGAMKYFRVNIPKRYRSEENAKHLMAVANAIKLKKLSKYEKEWVNIKAQERAREDPVIRFERENKKLLSDNLRLDTENDNLARQLVNSKIEMRKDIDRIEDEKDYFEKEYNYTKRLLDETQEEKKRLETETDQLKSVLKREVDKLDAELATRNNVIIEYKMITAQLSEKLEKAQKRSSFLAENEASSPQSLPTKLESNTTEELGKANNRIRELELELAQTKLALVETECKFQDLLHQVSTSGSFGSAASQAASSALSAAAGRGSKWFTKTLSSIKEGSSSSASSNKDSMKKSTSVDAIN